jgi:hypothetical protein
MRSLIINGMLIVAMTPVIALAQDTEAKKFSTLGQWKITAEHRSLSDERWCRAAADFDKVHIQILQGDLGSQYGEMLVVVNMKQRTLPNSYKGIARLLLDNKMVAAGRMDDVGHWQGIKRTAFYALATFEKVEGIKNKLKSAQKLTIAGDPKLFKPVTLQRINLNGVMQEMQRCLQ